MSPVPERPTEQELLEHNTTHSPPQAWCPHCAKAMARNDPHKRERKEVPDVEAELKEVPTLSVDLMYLYEKGEKPTLVAVDHDSGRVWSYALKDKTILQGNGWIQRRSAQDLENYGYKVLLSRKKIRISETPKHLSKQTQHAKRLDNTFFKD